MKDDDGMTHPPRLPGMVWWTCSYDRDGDRYAMDIPAATEGEALRLLHEQFGQGTVDGRLMGVVSLMATGGTFTGVAYGASQDVVGRGALMSRFLAGEGVLREHDEPLPPDEIVIVATLREEVVLEAWLGPVGSLPPTTPGPSIPGTAFLFEDADLMLGEDGDVMLEDG